MVINKFEDIESWKRARFLVSDIYSITSNGSFSKDFSLKDQIIRASVSIMSNLAEGFDSGTNKSFVRYLNISLGSASEVKSILYVALDQSYITKEKFNELYEKCDEIKRMITGLKKYLTKPKTSN